VWGIPLIWLSVGIYNTECLSLLFWRRALACRSNRICAFEVALRLAQRTFLFDFRLCFCLILVCSALGVDMFDCVFPCRTARFAVGFRHIFTNCFLFFPQLDRHDCSSYFDYCNYECRMIAFSIILDFMRSSLSNRFGMALVDRGGCIQLKQKAFACDASPIEVGCDCRFVLLMFFL
jgi:hypothetical protein